MPVTMARNVTHGLKKCQLSGLFNAAGELWQSRWKLSGRRLACDCKAITGCLHSATMNRICFLLVFFAAVISIHAQSGPDEQYIRIYQLIQEADRLNESG